MRKVYMTNIFRISVGIIICILLTTGSVLGASFKLPVTIDATGFERIDKPVDVAIDFTQLLNSIGQPGTIVENSIYVAETNNLWSIIDTSAPFQFDKDSGYNSTTKAAGTVVFIMKGTTPASGKRYYYIYFNTSGSSTPISVTPQVSLTDNVADEGMSSYKISNNRGIFYFQKAAGGFSSWTDISGNDWIGWSTASGPAGKYRGVPNAINPEGIFHPGFTCCISTIVSQGPIKIRIKSVNGTNWESIWDFYPDYATMTMTKTAHNYWFLYEGTPGGVLEQNKDFMVRSNGNKTFLNTSWTGDIAANEWIYVSDPSVGSNGRSIFVTHNEDDTLQDQYWPYLYMTVFAFGRKDAPLTQYLNYVPQHFTIGLMDGTNFTQSSKIIYSAYKNLTVTKGNIQQDGDAGFLIISSSPISDPSTVVGTQTFNITLNKNANIVWKIDGSTVKTQTGILSSSYTNSTAGIGVHTVNVTATNGTDIRSRQWTWTVEANIIGEIQITNHSAKDRQPSWSPDGQWIAFMSQRIGGADWDIFKIKKDVGESSVVRLTNYTGFDLEPSWWPNNRIAYSRGKIINNVSEPDIWAMNSDGTNQQQLTVEKDFDEYPDWSPDGTKIAYASVGGVSGGSKNIWVMNANGTGKKKLNTYYGFQPAWSPDGTKIAFKCYVGGSNICVMNANGSGVKQLTNNTANTHDPDWSPDGTRIAYASIKDGDWEIYVNNADGTNQKQLTSNIGIEDNYPAWSPDGQYISFMSNRTGNDEIWIISVSGSSNVFSITSSSPPIDPTTMEGTGQTFSIDVNKNANIVWRIDGSTVKTENGAITSSYTNSTTGIGTHAVSAIATNGTDVRLMEWTWTVLANVPSITVVSPNDGENWMIGYTKTISWDYNSDPGKYVRIELSKGGTLNSIITTNTSIGNSGTGSYNWLIPIVQIPGTDYNIRITSTNNSAYTDVGDNNFTISADPTTVNLGIAVKQGSGNVEVFRNDSGIWTSLGQTTTSQIYIVAKGVQLKIVGNPDSGNIFEKWITNTGSTVKNNPIIAYQNWPGTLDAYFNSTTSINVNLVVTVKQGSGNVEVFRNDSGTWTSLGQTTTSQTFVMTKGAQLKIVATPGSGQIFEKYISNTGSIITTNPFITNQNWDGSMDTYFNTTPIATVNLGIAIKQGSGNVEVFRNDSGIWTSLGQTTTSKTYSVTKGAQVKILATSDPGNAFVKWITNSGVTVKSNPIIAYQNWPGSLDSYFNTTV